MGDETIWYDDGNGGYVDQNGEPYTGGTSVQEPSYGMTNGDPYYPGSPYGDSLWSMTQQNPPTGGKDASMNGPASIFNSIYGTGKDAAMRVAGTQGALGMLGNYLGGSAQRTAANNALSGLQNAYAQAASGSQSQFQTALNLQAPYRQIGAGLAPTYTTFASAADPGRATLGQLAGDQGLYQWTNDELTRNLNNQLSARGMVNSGAGLRTLADAYRANAANQANQIWSRDTQLENSDYQRLSDAMNLGNGAAATGAQSAVGTGNTLASVYSGLGTGTANATNYAGAATNSMYQNTANAASNGLGNAMGVNNTSNGYWTNAGL